jgi:hypothetical protein
VIRVNVEIHCDVCQCDFVDGYTSKPKVALAEAKKHGWVRQRDADTKELVDVCPGCQKAKSEAKNGPHHQDEPG